MLSQRTIQLWEGGFYSGRGAVRETHHHVDTKRASCSLPRESFSLQRRGRRGNNTGRKLHFCRRSVLVVVCSQGIQSAPAEHGFVRSSDDDDGANQLGLGSDNVRVSPLNDARNGHEGLDPNNGPTSSNRRLYLRSPAPIPEGSRADSGAPEDPNNEGRSPDEEPSGVAAEPDAPKNSFETFVRARAVGRELANRCKDDDDDDGGGEELGLVSEEYYTPRVGDHVMGIVASGTFCRLDVNIGAKELGHLFQKDVMPLDLCNTQELAWEFQTSPPFAPPPRGIRFAIDEEVLSLLPEPPLAVEVGTVLAMEVQGMSPSGRALLSARSVAREYAWQRVRQLIEYNAVLEVQITEWTSAGLIAKVEGLRAFLPTYYLVNHVPEPSTPVSVSYKEYVGQKFTVMISSVDEKRSNLVISEKKAWMAKNAYIGALFEGTVTEIRPYGVHLLIKDTHISGVLHISNISKARVANVASLFSIGEKVKAMVVPSSAKNKISLSTADLESEHGLVLRDKQAVYQGAERIAAEYAKTYRNKHSVETNDRVEAVDRNLVIANLDWLDFGDQGEID